MGIRQSAKYLIGNEQETERSSSIAEDDTIIHAASANFDDRTMHDL